MKINKITNMGKFFEVVDSCDGSVMLTSKNGDRINLKSQLAKYVAFASVFTNEIVDELELECENPNDANKFLEFLLNG